METKYAAFFSYARSDDSHDGGALSEFRRALQQEIRAQTGMTFQIFQDRKDILVGQRWRQRIIESIDSTTLLITALSPSFMRSEQCREEVERFLKREAVLGRKDLIIPIYYIDLEVIKNEGDELLDELLERQYHDWRDLRFESTDSNIVRRKRAQIAGEIVRRLSEPISTASPDQHPEAVDDDDVDAEFGFIEIVAEAEEAMAVFPETLRDLSAEVTRLGEIASAADFSAAGEGPRPTAGRLALMRKLASEFEEPAERMDELSIQYQEQLQRVDAGIRALGDQIPNLETEEDRVRAVELLASLRDLNEKAGSSLTSLEGLKSTMTSVLKMSSTLRPVFTVIFRAMDRLIESGTVFAEWEAVIKSAIQENPDIDAGPES